jgi:hypothetical protein
MAPFAHTYFRRPEIGGENRLIAGTSPGVLSSRHGWPGRPRLAPTGDPRPAASRGGGGRLCSSGQQAWRRQREFASSVVGALQPHVFWVRDVPSVSVWVCESQHHRGVAVLRPAGVHSGRALRESSLRVEWRPSNNALHRAPPRNVLGLATTSGCAPLEAPFRHPVEGGAGELQNVRRGCGKRFDVEAGNGWT